MYLKGVVGPKVLYDVELTGMQYKPNRLRGLWEKLLSKATLVAADDERGSFLSRRDSFTRKTGLMSETNEVPWDPGPREGCWPVEEDSHPREHPCRKVLCKTSAGRNST